MRKELRIGPKIKIGQVWRRKKNSIDILIVAGMNGDTFRCVNLLNRKTQHHITSKTLRIYYDHVGTETKHG